jgi:large subunit ribosomal protein L6
MSRIGKRPVVMPKGVTAIIEGGVLRVKGPKGELSLNVTEGRFPAVEIKSADGAISVTRREETGRARAQQGLARSLIQNMVTGVAEGFSRVLDIVGVGYRAEAKGKVLNLSLGRSHPVKFAVPEGIQISVEKQTRLTVSGADKQLVGETAARIRRLRPPEPYKGKGILYAGEVIKRKVGKAAVGTTGG